MSIFLPLDPIESGSNPDPDPQLWTIMYLLKSVFFRHVES